MIGPYLAHPEVNLTYVLRQRANRGDFLVIQAILDHIRINAARESWRGRTDEVERLIDQNSLLTRATLSGNLELVQYLVINGADLNCRAVGYPFTPSNYAITSGHIDLIKYYAEDLHVDTGDWQGAAIQLAMKPTVSDLRNTEVIKYLITKDLIKVNGRNSNRSTLLHGATAPKLNQPKLIEALLKLKANPMVRDRTGKLAWDFSKFSRDVMYKFDELNFKPTVAENLWFVYYNDTELVIAPMNFVGLRYIHPGLPKRIFARVKVKKPDDVKLWIRLPENNVSEKLLASLL
jgi:hypothetical protein